MDFLTDTDTDMDPGWLNYAELDDVRRVQAAWDELHKPGFIADRPALRKIDWNLPA